MKRYDSYKPSGIEWIGEIPSHWSVNRLKFEIGLHGRIGWNGLRSDEFQVVSHAYLVTGQDFEGSDIPWDKCYQIDKERYEEDPFIQLKEGDILVTKDGSIGKVAMVRNLDKPACLNSGIFVLKQKHNAFNQLYLYWLLNSDIFKGFISYHQSGSTILHLYQNVFDNMPTVVPPMKEQIIMADYLDKKCGEIDRSIAKQQRRIELLEELKQSVITQAVTRGLDSNVPLRDSGIEWIGEIPKHWKVSRLKYFLKLLNGRAYSQSELLEAGKYRVLRVGNLFTNDNWYYSDLELEDDKYCNNGDLLYAWSASFGPYIWNGSKTIYHYHIWKVQYDESLIDKMYAYYVLKSVTNYMLATIHGSTMVHITMGNMNEAPIVIPPINEQKRISSHIKQKTAEIDSMIEREKKKIELMQELKQSIITEVVTGKRKVV